VLGGGPAGAAAARLLASWGHGVRLVAGDPRRGVPPRALAESIPPSAGKLFEALGVGAAIDEAGFVRSTGNTVWWGSGEPRVENFGAGRLGWQVTTDRLETILQQAAADAGARIERRSMTAAEALASAAGFRLDCTGRAGVLARALAVREDDARLRSVALVGAWRVRAAPWIPDDTQTLIESYADGWAWSVPVDERLRHVAVMVDPRSSNLAAHGQAREVYLAEIAKTRQFRALLAEGSALEEGPRGWDASMYGSSRYVAGETLLVGDAGSFIDPLSSAGVRKALVSAWVAAIAVHTALTRPERRTMALRFHEERELALYAALRKLTAGHLADAARSHDDPFWTDRALDFVEPGVGRADVASGLSRIGPDQVRDAYEDLRRRPHSSLQLAPAVRVEARAVIEGCEIVSRSHLVAEDDEAPVRFLYDVELPELVAVATAESDPGAMFDRYCRRRGEVALPQFLTALSTLVARGWLCYKGHTEGPGS
jgi:flavin-dependent dehydrogenase